MLMRFRSRTRMQPQDSMSLRKKRASTNNPISKRTAKRAAQTVRETALAAHDLHTASGRQRCATTLNGGCAQHFPFTIYDLRFTISKMLKLENLAELLETNRAAASARVKEFSIGGRKFNFNSQAAIMGVVNLSADSWYRESVCLSAEAAIARGKVLHAQGAHIIDVGAESTLAHTARADAVAQKSKLIPVIKKLRAEKILVSVETYSPEVARAALEAGANILNLTGTAGSKEIFKMVAAHEAAVIICYVAGKNVREVGDFDLSSDPIPMLAEFFSRQIEIAQRSGVEKIFLDPGLGFYYRNLQDSAVRVRHQMNIFLNTFRLHALGFPICHAQPHAFEFFGGEVRCAEPFFAVLAALGKTDLFRTHEVPRTKAVLDTLKVF
jgi:dihydropteroate synthase